MPGKIAESSLPQMDKNLIVHFSSGKFQKVASADLSQVFLKEFLAN
jgi:hypothetical protein